MEMRRVGDSNTTVTRRRPFDNSIGPNGTFYPTQDPITAFSTDVELDSYNISLEGSILAQASWLPKGTASDVMNGVTCRLTGATVNYPVTISNNTISLQANSSWATDTFGADL